MANIRRWIPIYGNHIEVLRSNMRRYIDGPKLLLAAAAFEMLQDGPAKQNLRVNMTKWTKLRNQYLAIISASREKRGKLLEVLMLEN